MRIINRTERLLCFPPLTIYPPEAKAKRQPGESVSMMTMPDGSEAAPTRTYPGISAPPGVTTGQPGAAPRGTPEKDVPQVPLDETHDEAYWAVIKAKAKKLIDAGYVEFRGSEVAEDREERDLRLMGEAAKSKVDLSSKDERIALQFVAVEDDREQLLKWKAQDMRAKVKKAVDKRLSEL